MARTDAIVLGAGIVGTSIALHLVKRGLAVTLLDRRGPGEETSFGNTGVIGSTVYPAAFPRSIAKLIRVALQACVRGELSLARPAAAHAVAAGVSRSVAPAAACRDRARHVAPDGAGRGRARGAARGVGRHALPAPGRPAYALPLGPGPVRPVDGARARGGARCLHQVSRPGRRPRAGAGSRAGVPGRGALARGGQRDQPARRHAGLRGQVHGARRHRSCRAMPARCTAPPAAGASIPPKGRSMRTRR